MLDTNLENQENALKQIKKEAEVLEADTNFVFQKISILDDISLLNNSTLSLDEDKRELREKKQHSIWNFFSLIEEREVYCLLCKVILSMEFESPQNLENHLISEHSNIYEEDSAQLSEDLDIKEIEFSEWNVTETVLPSLKKDFKETNILLDPNVKTNQSVTNKIKQTSNQAIKNTENLKFSSETISETVIPSQKLDQYSSSESNFSFAETNYKHSRKRNIKILNFFSPPHGENVSCSLCNTTLPGKSGIQSMKWHLIKTHPGTYEEHFRNNLNSNTKNIKISDCGTTNTSFKFFDDSDITETSSNYSEYLVLEDRTVKKNEQPCDLENLGSKTELIDHQIVKMIVKSYYNFSIVEDKEFQKLSQMLNPAYNIPSKKTLSTLILPQLYSNKRNEIKSKIKFVKSASLSIDGWNSMANENFIAVTCHYLNEDFKLQAYLLDCFEFDAGNKVAENIYKQLKHIINEWDLQGKIIAVVSEENADMIAAIGKGKWQHITCFAKKLNVIAQNIVSDDTVSVIKNKIRKIVQYLNKNNTILKSISFQKGINIPKVKLIQDDSVRWSSTLQMFCEYLELKESTDFVSLINDELVLPDHLELKIIGKICGILKIFEDIANELSKETNVSLSEFKIFVKALEKFIKTKLEAESDPCIRNLLKNIWTDINEMFDIYNLPFSELYLESSLLDPRFKKLAFNEKDNFDCIIENIVQKAAKFNFSKQPAQSNCSQKKTSNVLWAEFDELVSKCGNNLNISNARTEINHYLLEPLLDRTMDPLIWWQKRQNIYPHICELMKQRLTIPATSIPGGRIFAKTGQAVIYRRSQFSTAEVNKSVFLNSNW